MRTRLVAPLALLAAVAFAAAGCGGGDDNSSNNSSSSTTSSTTSSDTSAANSGGAAASGERTVRVMTSATNGLELALLAAGVGPGTEVIVPAMTFVATANVVVRVGARPVFADVDLRSRNLTPQAVERAITARTRAIMPVHYAGLAVDLDPIYEIARSRGLRVVEDLQVRVGVAADVVVVHVDEVRAGRGVGALGVLVDDRPVRAVDLALAGRAAVALARLQVLLGRAHPKGEEAVGELRQAIDRRGHEGARPDLGAAFADRRGRDVDLGHAEALALVGERLSAEGRA